MGLDRRCTPRVCDGNSPPVALRSMVFITVRSLPVVMIAQSLSTQIANQGQVC